MNSQELAAGRSQNKARTYAMCFIIGAGIVVAAIAPMRKTPSESAAPFPAGSGLGDGPSAAVKPADSPAASTTCFIIKRVSLTTDSGIRSIPIGTAANVVAKSTLGYRIRLADGTELDATPDQISSDPQVASQVAAAERAADVARAEALRMRAEAEQARHRQVATAANAPHPTPPSVNTPSTPLASTDSSAQSTPPAAGHPMTGTLLDQKATEAETKVNRKKK